MNEAAISEIRKYADEWLFPPAADWPAYYFAERSYSIWAANEIINRLEEESKTPIQVISEFINELHDAINHFGLSRRMEIVFEIAIETAENILWDLFA